ncbi:lamin tail domain-containing protein [Candidatus Woesearchaeota archaeon]|nr:lamin tail domain-containing protein [Candidatus Woesearchaeota archaeon]
MRHPVLPLLWTIAIILATGSGNLTITEILFDPAGADNNREFIEVTGAEDLSGWVIADSHANDTLVLLQNGTSGFALIVEDGFNLSGLGCTAYSLGAAIGNGLGNDGDTITILVSRTAIATASYDASAAAIPDGHSLSLVNGSWQASRAPGGTPCAPNDALTVDGQNGSALEYANSTCRLMIGIETEKTIYLPGEQIRFGNTLEPRPQTFAIEYWIEDLFGDIVKQPYVTANLNMKSYTPKLEGPIGAFIVKNRLVNASGDCLPPENGSSALLVVKGERHEPETRVRIDSIALGKDGVASVGETIDVLLDIEKGDTSKRVVSVYALFHERISSTVQLSLSQKGSAAQITVPLLLKDYCRLSGKGGDARIVVEGLGKKDTEAFPLDWDGCLPAVEEKAPGSSAVAGTASAGKGFAYAFNLTRSSYLPEETATVEIRIVNGGGKPVSLSAWSHIHDGRIDVENAKDNLQEATVPPGAGFTFALASPIGNRTGRLMLKAELLKEGNQNPYTKTFTINVSPFDSIPAAGDPEKGRAAAAPAASPLPLTGALVAPARPIEAYEGSSYTARRLAPYLFAGLLLLGAIIFATRKRGAG